MLALRGMISGGAGGERYTGLGGREAALQPGDMYIRDEAGILSSILYGPDDRTQIRPATRAVVFCVYAPEGLGAETVDRHLSEKVCAKS